MSTDTKRPARTRTLIPLVLSCVVGAGGCAHVPLEPSAAGVEVRYALDERVPGVYLGDVIGADGNMLTSWFISNRNLTRGALNDIKNRAHAMGGDTVFILLDQLSYTTSTVFVGSVYRCDPTPDA